MFTYLEEACLFEYFCLQAVVGRLGKDCERVFRRLGEVFLLTDEESTALFARTEKEEVTDVLSAASYAQYCRIRQYAQMMHIDLGVDEQTEEMILLKGKAFAHMKACELAEDGEGSPSVARRALMRAANKGSVIALRLYGVLLAEGIFTERNLRAAVKNFTITAKWNNAEGLFYALYYDKENREKNIARLKTALYSDSQESILREAENAYAVKASLDFEAWLLEKAFKGGLLQRDCYSPQYARIIFSEAIAGKDKEKLLFSTGRDTLTEMSDLPLKLTKKQTIPFDKTGMDGLPMVREKEQNAIANAMKNIDIRGERIYRPMCFSYQSPFVANAYADALAACFAGAQVERIEVADLTPSDFEPTKSNIFIRSCNEQKPNVYLLYFKGKIPSGIMQSVKSFLQSDKRARFRINRPSVCLDLSAVLPVCFCDKENERELESLCDIITLGNVAETERSEVLQSLLRQKESLYSIPKIVWEKGAQSAAAKLSVDEINALLDKAIRLNRSKGETLAVTEELVNGYTSVAKAKTSVYGFGGAKNEDI